VDSIIEDKEGPIIEYKILSNKIIPSIGEILSCQKDEAGKRIYPKKSKKTT
jgi:hypothetical protein